MKKLFFAICMMLISASAFAQQGKTTLGFHGDYMIDSPKNFGIGANIGYEVIDNVRGVAEFNYLLKKDGISFWNVEINAEYLFKISDGKFIVYPLAGVDLLGQSVGGHSESKLGLNLGAGIEVPIADAISFKAEYNYKTQGDGWSLLKAGIVIPF